MRKRSASNILADLLHANYMCSAINYKELLIGIANDVRATCLLCNVRKRGASNIPAPPLRGCDVLLHKTLNIFDWYVTCVNTVLQNEGSNGNIRPRSREATTRSPVA